MIDPKHGPCVGVVLAAGASSRMGQVKALLERGGRPLVLAWLDALAPRCGALRVVVGAHGAALRACLAEDPRAQHRAIVVDNPGWKAGGPLRSLQLALQGLAEDCRVLVAPVDTPPAPLFVLDALLASGDAALPCWQDRPGHPVLSTAGQLRQPADSLRDLVVGAHRVPVDWPDCVVNLNRPEDWRRWLGLGQSTTGG